MKEDNRPIDPLKIAEKLRSVRNFELPPLEKQIGARPELVELLWFIQWASMPENYAGGLRRFCDDFLSQKGDSLCPSELRSELSKPAFTASTAAALVTSFPEIRQFDGIAPLGWEEISDPLFSPEVERERSIQSLAKSKTPRQIQSALISEIREILPHYLRALCEQSHVLFVDSPGLTSVSFEPEDPHYRDPSVSASRWMTPPALAPRVCDELVAWMRERESAIHKLVAETRVTAAVRKWVERSYKTGYPVWLSGSCRWGKTETARNLAAARPGLRRMVETPDDNSQASLCRAIAKALGIPCKDVDTALTLRDKIALVLAETKIQLIFDEAHFLWPAHVTAATRPQRLDLVRRLLIDQGIPAVFISTPQSYAQSRKSLVRKTGFSIGQFEGRLLNEKPIELPEEISVEEKIAVATIHFPGVSDTHLELVVRRVSVSLGSSIYALIAKLAKTAQVIAQEHGRDKMITADILEAANEILPSLKEASTKEVEAPTPTISQGPRRAADLVGGGAKISSARRVNVPSAQTDGGRRVLSMT